MQWLVDVTADSMGLEITIQPLKGIDLKELT